MRKRKKYPISSSAETSESQDQYAKKGVELVKAISKFVSIFFLWPSSVVCFLTATETDIGFIYGKISDIRIGQSD